MEAVVSAIGARHFGLCVIPAKSSRTALRPKKAYHTGHFRLLVHVRMQLQPATIITCITLYFQSSSRRRLTATLPTDRVQRQAPFEASIDLLAIDGSNFMGTPQAGFLPVTTTLPSIYGNTSI